MKIKLNHGSLSGGRQKCSLNGMHWETMPKNCLKISQESCVAQRELYLIRWLMLSFVLDTFMGEIMVLCFVKRFLLHSRGTVANICLLK